jgi:isopentenyl-diphosphate delta-isomerase
MLQQRASQNTIRHCYGPIRCSHQRDGETNIQAGSRRLFEEMGLIQNSKSFSFYLQSSFDNGLTEHELDHVMIGYYDDAPNINREEVEDWKWMKIEDVKSDMETHPALYTGLVQNYFR